MELISKEFGLLLALKAFEEDGRLPLGHITKIYGNTLLIILYC
jgi:hypothetical protein